MTGFSHLGANITKMNTTEIQVLLFFKLPNVSGIFRKENHSKYSILMALKLVTIFKRGGKDYEGQIKSFMPCTSLTMKV